MITGVCLTHTVATGCVRPSTTTLTPFVLIRPSLLYRGRVIPLAWRAMRHRNTQVSFEANQLVLDQVHAIVPPVLMITLLPIAFSCMSNCFTPCRSFTGAFVCDCRATPWFVVSDEPTTARTLDEHGLRFDIEESFLDEKSYGYQIHTVNWRRPKLWSMAKY